MKSAIFALLLTSALARAQQSPHLGYVYPAGGRIGSTFQVVVGGQFLNNATNAFFSADDVQAEFVRFNRPMNQGEFNKLRDRLRELEERQRDVRRNRNSTNIWTSADEKEAADIRAKILKNPPNRNATPALSDVVTLQVSIATNVAPGDREFRLAAPNGLSNPLKFCIGELREFSTEPAKTKNPGLDRFLRQLGQPPQTNSARTERIVLPCVVNGQITPGGVDRFRFSARRGQQIVVSVAARKLIPYLADAVPGWFQAAVSVSDAKGRELAYDDHFRFHPDPVICCKIPRDGDYVLTIRDSIYRGREDFVYRITIGELPFVTSIFPLGGTVGQRSEVTLTGWNLSATNLALDNSTQVPGIGEISRAGDESFANVVPFALDSLPETFESEPNGSRPQRVVLPVIVNGQIGRRGDADVFSFAGKAGDEIVAEVIARRLNSPLDSTLELTDTSGHRIAFNDDWEDKSSGLETHHADSYLRATLPKTGSYLIRLTDAERNGGPEFGYRLRISAPQPDFALRIVPSSIVARGGIAAVSVFALRKDGFTNAISLRLNDAPRGFVLAGATIPANQDRVRFTLAAPPSKSSEPVILNLEGFAVDRGREIIRPAVPAEDMMQAFAYRHLVPTKELCLIAAGFGPQRTVRIVPESPMKLAPGRTARVHLTGVGPAFVDRFKLELDEPPDGISIGKTSITRDGVELQFTANSKLKPGLAGNLIVNLFAERARANRKAPAANRRAPVGVLPAISFETVAE